MAYSDKLYESHPLPIGPLHDGERLIPLDSPSFRDKAFKSIMAGIKRAKPSILLEHQVNGEALGYVESAHVTKDGLMAKFRLRKDIEKKFLELNKLDATFSSMNENVTISQMSVPLGVAAESQTQEILDMDAEQLKVMIEEVIASQVETLKEELRAEFAPAAEEEVVEEEVVEEEATPMAEEEVVEEVVVEEEEEKVSALSELVKATARISELEGKIESDRIAKMVEADLELVPHISGLSEELLAHALKDESGYKLAIACASVKGHKPVVSKMSVRTVANAEPVVVKDLHDKAKAIAKDKGIRFSEAYKLAQQ